MNKVLIKYKEMSFLMDESNDESSLQDLINLLPDMYDLYVLSHSIYTQGLFSTEDENKLKLARAQFADFKTKYNVIGYPFDAKDAMLYALSQNMEYSELRLG